MKPAAVGIVFDLDNTLVRSRIDFGGMRRAVMQYIEQYIARRSETESGLRQLPPGFTDLTIGQMIEASRRIWTGTDRTEALWEIVTAFETKGMEDLSLEPGAVEVAAELAGRGHLLAVCTNNARASAFKALAPFGDPPPFDLVITREDVVSLKPSPEGLLAIKAAWRPLGVRKLVMVGDSWLDGKAAEDAGMPYVEYHPSQPPPSRQLDRPPVQAWLSIDDLRDLLRPELFAGLEGDFQQESTTG